MSKKVKEQMEANLDSTMKILKEESNQYHLIITDKYHDEKNKRYIEQPRMAKMSIRDFDSFDKDHTALGYTDVKIIHDPKKPLKAEKVKAPEAPKVEEPKKAEEPKIEDTKGSDSKDATPTVDETIGLKEILDAKGVEYHPATGIVKLRKLVEDNK